MVLLL
jgi:hypothetical protein